jgi:putative MATE family efflux protein
MPANETGSAGPDPAFQETVTRGVSLLRGDPKTAIRKLSGPMIVAMLLTAIYNLADAVWVAGLGADALAGVGFITPLFMILMALSVGLGAGATSVVARRIGSRDKQGADNAAVHAIILSVPVSAVLLVILVLFLRPIIELMGAGSATDLAVEYGSIVFLGSIFFLVAQIAYAVLRAEGDTRRTMYVMALSSVLNIVLDPILIYWAGLGIAGAAWATVISIFAVVLVIGYWFFVRKDTYVTIALRTFSPDPQTFRAILGVGLPASIEMLLMSAVVIIINAILVHVAGADAVAVFTSGWRIVMFAIVPLNAISTSVVSVVGAAYGAREYDRIRVAHRYTITIGVVIALVTSLLTYLLAPLITTLFTYAPENASLVPMFILFFQTMCLFYPFTPLGMFSSSVFQGTGHGLTSLVISLFRNLVFIAVFSYLLAVVFGFAEMGVFMVAGNILGGLVGYLWARTFIARLIRTWEAETGGLVREEVAEP